MVGRREPPNRARQLAEIKATVAHLTGATRVQEALLKL
eukprot:COSAG01_NODE_20322_length_959_cov_136.095349_1_plen_37_part_10